MATQTPEDTLFALDAHTEATSLATVGSPSVLIDLAREHGEVFTRRWIVDLILDSVGYTADRDLAALRLAEPSCGDGAFLLPIVQRLSDSCRRRGRPLEDALGAVQAADLLARNVEKARRLVTATLLAAGWSQATAEHASLVWVRQADYLLSPFEARTFDFVVGNPPYIRPEDLPEALNQQYRKTWPSMLGRADIYVGFLERGLRSLRDGGRLGFICADRWMRNQYGRGLRELVAEQYSVLSIIVMHDVDAFEDAVSAYPAVMVFAREPQGEAMVVDTTSAFGEEGAREVLKFGGSEDSGPVSGLGFQAAKLPHWFGGRESWPAGSPERLRMIEYLTDNFPPLEDVATGTKVGIGVATGADGVYVVKNPPDVEPDRLLPLSMARDLASGTFEWSGHYLVSPWDDDGLVSLADYPKLAAYYESQGLALRKRHIAEKRPTTWYQTIDRVHGKLTARPKLLMPDMRMTINPVLDPGKAYPHHNLYYVISDGWDIEVLGGLLLSRVANAFVEAYAVKMRGGTLRFQAQYLRRIRVPRLADVTAADKEELARAFRRRDVNQATASALRLYGLDRLAE